MEEETNSTLRADVPMSFRVTAEERLLIIQTAKDRNMSVSNFLRSIALCQPNSPQSETNEKTYVENDLTFENQLLIEENEMLKKQIRSDALIIPCSQKQRELLQIIYHSTVFSDEEILPEGFDELPFENNLLLALFILPNLIGIVTDNDGDLLKAPFINCDAKEFYPLLKLDYDEFGDAIFETILTVSSNEEKLATKIINQYFALKKT